MSLNNFQLHLGDNITFLSATGGIHGTFGTVVNPFSTGTMVSPAIVYGPTSLSLEGVQSSFVQLVGLFEGVTGNQNAVAQVLDNACTDPGCRRSFPVSTTNR